MPVSGSNPEILTEEEKGHVQDLIDLGLDDYVAFLKVLLGLYPDSSKSAAIVEEEENSMDTESKEK